MAFLDNPSYFSIDNNGDEGEVTLLLDEGKTKGSGASGVGKVGQPDSSKFTGVIFSSGRVADENRSRDGDSYSDEPKFSDHKLSEGQKFSEGQKSSDQKFSDQKFPDQRFPDQKFPDQRFPDQRFPDQKFPDQKFPDQKFSDQKFPDQKFSDQRTSDQRISDQKFSDQRISDQKFSQNKKGSRSLLRTMSNTSADSNHELLIMGEPRLSDIAPDLGGCRTASAEPRRSNSLKNKPEPLQSNDFNYCPIPAHEPQESAATYYNFTATDSRRRHSIGTFMSRERTTSVASSKSYKDEAVHAMLPATPDEDGSIPKKPSNAADILIISFKNSQAPNLWVDYFTSYCEQISKQANRKKFRIQHLGIEEIVEANGDVAYIAEKMALVKLQLIIICPSLLEHTAAYSEHAASVGKLIFPDRALALLLGVTDDDITSVHLNAFLSYPQWQRLSVEQDEDANFTKNFLSTAMTIFSKVWKKQTSVIQEQSQFSVTPKKVTPGQNSVVILLNTPLVKDDILKISVEKNNELVEITSYRRRNPYTIKLTIPERLTEVSAIVNVVVEKNSRIIGNRPIKCESRMRELEQILKASTNPVGFLCQALGFGVLDKEKLDDTLQRLFLQNVPPNFNLFGNHLGSVYGVSGNGASGYGSSGNGSGYGPSGNGSGYGLSANGSSYGPSGNGSGHNTSGYGSGPGASGYGSGQGPSGYGSGHGPSGYGSGHGPSGFPVSGLAGYDAGQRHSREEFPTLLHFAAKFGLEKLTMQLLDCPGGDLACEIQNNCNMIPADMADAAGHAEVSNMLRGYMKMNEFTTTYAKLKELSMSTPGGRDNPHLDGVDEDLYLIPRSAEEVYKICPPPRPVNTVGYMRGILEESVPVFEESRARRGESSQDETSQRGSLQSDTSQDGSSQYGPYQSGCPQGSAFQDGNSTYQAGNSYSQGASFVGGTSQDGCGTYEDCCKSSKDCHGSSKNYHGSSKNCHGSPKNCHGSANDCCGSSDDCCRSSKDCHASSKDCCGSSKCCETFKGTQQNCNQQTSEEDKGTSKDSQKASKGKKETSKDKKGSSKDETKDTKTKENHKAPKENLKTSKENPKTSKEKLKASKENHKASKESLKTSKESLKTSKESLKTSKESLKTAKENCKTSKESPRNSRENARASQETQPSLEGSYRSLDENHPSLGYMAMNLINPRKPFESKLTSRENLKRDSFLSDHNSSAESLQPLNIRNRDFSSQESSYSELLYPNSGGLDSNYEPLNNHQSGSNGNRNYEPSNCNADHTNPNPDQTNCNQDHTNRNQDHTNRNPDPINRNPDHANRPTHLPINFRPQDNPLRNVESSRRTPPASEDKVQTELLEIINDFKNNVHSIAQAERLVEEWKSRNDVQKSFREKQDQLHHMRLRYEKMQQDMKGDAKKHNPFERFLRLFTRNKQHLPSGSSSNSGRMSIISGSSVGDGQSDTMEQVEKLDQTDGIDKTDRRNFMDRRGQTSGIDHTPGIGRTQGIDQTPGIDQSSAIYQSQGIFQTPEINQTSAMDQASAMDQTSTMDQTSARDQAYTTDPSGIQTITDVKQPDNDKQKTFQVEGDFSSDFSKAMSLNYMIPPAPKPVKFVQNKCTMTQNKSSMAQNKPSMAQNKPSMTQNKSSMTQNKCSMSQNKGKVFPTIQEGPSRSVSGSDMSKLESFKSGVPQGAFRDPEYDLRSSLKLAVGDGPNFNFDDDSQDSYYVNVATPVSEDCSSFSPGHEYMNFLHPSQNDA